MADIDFSREDFSVGPAADASVLGVEPSQKSWRAKPPQNGDGQIGQNGIIIIAANLIG
jgi:hypothetical protein